ncbi:FKBP-type peptidyl-prolyl cis-trans isomerase [Novosphingobium sp. PASSN1]|uniref:FKBP-type peptidyl-prolyl cis-trans isomerase n=1 Tax=Novosphingobium sp. PASSN1 TaxID=2015561 RepID=UPI0025FEAE3E|nr:FKBP-type peptidyl-prolyl cis-trans isomerase [Novosphingobium sp. PASSN1]
MSNQPRGLRRIALSVTLAALAAVPSLAAAQAAAPTADILPVPLQPVVPAAQRVCSAATASGLGTRVLRDAQAAKPARGDYVLVNYIGYLAADGTVFDQNVTQAFSTGAVIKGFSEGLLLMNKGSVWRFCIPAALGYGEKATGPIPANSDLVFQVELVDFKSEAEVTALRAAAEKQGDQPKN